MVLLNCLIFSAGPSSCDELCQNGGTFEDTAHGFMCACTAGYTGPHCESGNGVEIYQNE